MSGHPRDTRGVVPTKVGGPYSRAVMMGPGSLAAGFKAQGRLLGTAVSKA